jgi:hypothetical protein
MSKKNALCYDEFVSERFLLLKKKVKSIVGIMKCPHQKNVYPLFLFLYSIEGWIHIKGEVDNFLFM